MDIFGSTDMSVIGAKIRDEVTDDINERQYLHDDMRPRIIDHCTKHIMNALKSVSEGDCHFLLSATAMDYEISAGDPSRVSMFVESDPMSKRR